MALATEPSKKDPSGTVNVGEKRTAASSGWRSAVPVVSLVAFWLVALAVVSTGGDFPLNDDWIYSEGVEHFLHTGELRLLACAPACIFHMVSGIVVCKIFGFSHIALRCLGLFWAVVGTLSVYGTCRELGMRRLHSNMFALVWAGNPMVVNLAFSFMTDMPALALISLYTYLFVRALKRRCEWSFLAAGIALSLAACVRQNFAMLAIPNAIALMGLCVFGRFSFSLLGFCVIMPLASGYAADKWMTSSNDFPELYLWYKGRAVSTVKELFHAPSRLAGPMMQTAGCVVSYMGLFALPILVALLARPSTFFGRKPAVAPVFTALSAGFIGYTTALFASAGKLMPFNQNLLRLPHVGAHTILGINYFDLPAKARAALTGVSAAAGMLLVSGLLESGWRTLVLSRRQIARHGFFRGKNGAERDRNASYYASARPVIACFLLTSFLCQFGCVVLQSSFNDLDRYYIVPLLSAIFCLGLLYKWFRVRRGTVAGIFVAALLSLYSVAACQDMMAWNTARWRGLMSLEASGVSPGAIDGGAEYNYYRQPELFKRMKIHPTWYEFLHKGDPPRDTWRWWTVDREDYIVSFSPVPGYETVAQEKYWSLLSLKTREILVLKRL